MSHTVPISECPDPSVHGRPFRYCPYCEWREEPAPKTSITIPWPPSDELVERVARTLYGIYSRNRVADYEDITDPRPWRAAAGMVLAEVGGDGDE